MMFNDTVAVIVLLAPDGIPACESFFQNVSCTLSDGVFFSSNGESSGELLVDDEQAPR